MATKTTPEIPDVLDWTEQEVTLTRTPCLCGCGGFPTRESADFIPGHDAKYKAMLIAAHLANRKLVIRDAEGEHEVTPMELAERRFWGGYLTDAAKKRDAKAKADAEKAKAASTKAA